MTDPTPELRALRASMQETNARLSFRNIAGAVALGVFMGGMLIGGLYLLATFLQGVVSG